MPPWCVGGGALDVLVRVRKLVCHEGAMKGAVSSTANNNRVRVV